MTDGRDTPDGPGRPAGDDDLVALVEELSTTLESLQSTVESDPVGRIDRRGPAPPTPRELLRFTERYTIPTLIALLESGVRSLELLGATLRLLDGRGIDDASPATRERVGAVGRTTLDRVDTVLEDLQSALEGGEPSDPTARDLLADARSLREEIDRRLAEATDDRERGPGGTASRTAERGTAEGRAIPVRSADEPESTDDDGAEDAPDEDVAVDVDAELESIRRDVKGDRDRGSSDTDGDRSGDESEAEDEDLAERRDGDGTSEDG